MPLLIKKPRLGLALYLLMLAASLAVPALLAAEQTRPIQPLRPLQQADRLQVNTGGGPALVVQATQDEGEAQLRQLAETSGLEEGWAYIPSETLWIEIASGEKVNGRKTYHVLDDTVYLLLKKYDDIVLYHIHPRSTFRSDIDGPFKQLQWTVGEALPSYSDMAVMINLSGFFHNFHPDGKIDWRIVSRHGVTRYGMTPEAIAAKDTIELKKFSYRPLDQDDDAEWLQQTGAIYDPMGSGKAVQKVISKCANRLSGPQVWVAFSPLIDFTTASQRK